MDFKEFLIDHEFFHLRISCERPKTVYLDTESDDQETFDLSANQVEQEPIEKI